ncbi:MAG: hypothetical protein LBE56_07495 [Tannerella sp.]|nr:hypothetical protein [Tannerella sp.]
MGILTGAGLTLQLYLIHRLQEKDADSEKLMLSTQDLIDNGIGIAAEKTNHFCNYMKYMQQRMTQIDVTFEIATDAGTCLALRAALGV